MWEAILPPEHLRDVIRQFVSQAPVSFVQLIRLLPQLRGSDDLALDSGSILWRGLSQEGICALRDLHNDRKIFFWLCSPALYTGAGYAPFLRLFGDLHSAEEPPWLPTVIHSRPPSAAETLSAARSYVAAVQRLAMDANEPAVTLNVFPRMQ